MLTILRDSIVEAFISIIHGLISPDGKPEEHQWQTLTSYALDMLSYIDAILNMPGL